MIREDFADSPAGRLVTTVKEASAFVPNPLPPDLDISHLSGMLSDATLLTGELRGIGSTLSNPYVLISPFQRREAVASSNIEGTVTSLTDLFMLEAGANEARRPPDTREVANYARALNRGIKRLETLPLSTRLFRELHKTLLTGLPKYRGGSCEPGEFRRDQNWIGRVGGSISSARFVPPPPNELARTLSDLEKYIHAEDANAGDVLVKAALTHYQFEVIHPFPDGNGRVGRILIPLVLCAKRVLPVPLLYLSPFFERRHGDYMHLLLDVSQSGNWAAWVEFFLEGVLEQCQDTITRIHSLNKLRENYRRRLAQSKSSAKVTTLVDRLFESPVITIPTASEVLRLTYASAKRHVEHLTADGVLTEITDQERPRLFMASEIFDIVDPDLHWER